MKTHSGSKKPSKLFISIICVVIGAVVVATLIGLFIVNKDSNTSVAVTEENKSNAQKLEVEIDKDPVVITDEEPVITEPDTTENQSTSPQPTIDAYGASTKLDRPNIEGAVIAVQTIYADFLSKLRAVPENERQATADQYMIENNAYFSPSFNYAYPNNLHLLPQSYNIALPTSVRAYSAIIDPSEPSQTIVQLFMDPDKSWSILVVVKMKDNNGSFGTFEKLMPRMNQNPL